MHDELGRGVRVVLDQLRLLLKANYRDGDTEPEYNRRLNKAKQKLPLQDIKSQKFNASQASMLLR